MSATESSSSPGSLSMAPEKKLYWVCSGPLFESSLFVVPSIPRDAESGDYLPGTEVKPFSLSLLFFDADGALVSESQISVSRFGPTIFELGQFLESMKLEGGLRHGTMLVEGPPGWHCEVRVHSIKSASFMSPVATLSANHGSFLPIGFSADTTHMAVLINQGKEAASVKCRLYVGKRSPEITIDVPRNGSRVVGIEAVFAEYLENMEEHIPGYLRLTTRSEDLLGVQLIERTASKRETGIFGVIG